MSDIIKTIRAEIERLKKENKCPSIHTDLEFSVWSAKDDLLDDILHLLDTFPEQPVEGLEEELKRYINSEEYINTRESGLLLIARHFVEWQKEQDQPITGNSLEQEWLRYVDRRKKECGGELPFLGEYGWLQIARHFAEWQKAKMMEGAVEGKVAERIQGKLYARCQIPSTIGVEFGDKVRVIIIKEDK